VENSGARRHGGKGFSRAWGGCAEYFPCVQLKSFQWTFCEIFLEGYMRRSTLLRFEVAIVASEWI
jgi:hypothetical protein